MALTFATGFEYGVTPVTTGAGLADGINTGGTFTLAIDTSPVRSGTYSLNIAATGDNATNYAQFTKTLGSGGISVARVYFIVNTLPGSGESYLVQLSEGTGTSWATITVDSAGLLRAAVEAGTPQTGPTITTGTWYRLDLKYDTSGTTWKLDWQVDGAAQTQATEGGHSASTGTKQLLLSAENTANTTSDFNFDDVAGSITDTDYPIGPGKVLLAPLASAANHQTITLTEWQYTDNFSSFTNFASQTETDSPSRLGPPISTATATGFRMNTTSAVAGNGRWPIDAPADMPSGDAQMVSALICVREASTGTNNATFRTELSGSTTNIFSGNPGWGTTWNYLGSFMATKPGGGTWTKTDVDAMNFEADSTDASPNIWCQGVVYEVAFATPLSQIPDVNYPRGQGAWS